MENAMRPFKGSRTEENLRYISLAGARFAFGQAGSAKDGRLCSSAVWPCLAADGQAALALVQLECLRADEPLKMPALAEGSVEYIAAAVEEIADDHAGLARVAREQGLDELADWHETLAKASRPGRRQRPHGLKSLAPIPRAHGSGSN
jgi:hypothetical protein